MGERQKHSIDRIIPTYDSVGDVNEALMLLDEAFVKLGWDRERIDRWWDQPRKKVFDGMTPAGAWHYEGDSGRKVFTYVMTRIAEGREP